MMTVEDFLEKVLQDENSLTHYASPYYDPVKAHEYYMQNRKLKGRNTASLTNRTEEGVTYAKAKISEARNQELSNFTTTQQAAITKLQSEGVSKAEAIKKKLQDTIAANADRILASLDKLPPDATPALRKRLLEGNARQQNKARQDASKALVGISKAITAARAAYSKGIADINTKYQNIAATEEQNIRANVR